MEGQGARKEVVMEKEEVTIKFWSTKQCSKLTTLSPWLIWALCTSSLCPLWKISLLSLWNSLNIWVFLPFGWKLYPPSLSTITCLSPLACFTLTFLRALSHIFDHALLLALHKTQDHTQMILVLFCPLMKACHAFQ